MTKYALVRVAGSGRPTPGPLRSRDLPVEIHYLVIIGVIALLIVLIAIDMTCFCTRDWGILACICGGPNIPASHHRGDIISLDGAE